MKCELVSLLDQWGAIERARLAEESGDAFASRLRVQKAAYLLHYLGVEPFDGFEFSQNLHGPYEPELARFYFAGRPLEFVADEKMLALLRWFVLHKSGWLRVASTALSICEYYPGIKESEAYELATLSLPWLGRKEFARVWRALERKGLCAGQKQNRRVFIQG